MRRTCDITNGFPGFVKTSDDAFRQSGSTWGDIILGTSVLNQGSYYILCIDMDGGPVSCAPEGNPLKIGEALEVCIVSIQSLQSDTILASQDQRILFSCQTCDPSVAAEIYLAAACDTLSYGIAAVQGSRKSLELFGNLSAFPWSWPLRSSVDVWSKASRVTRCHQMSSGLLLCPSKVVPFCGMPGGQDYRLCVDQVWGLPSL